MASINNFKNRTVDELKSSISKTDAICRTCLSKQIKMYSVFENFIESVTLYSAINAVTGVKIQIDDGLPHIICIDCKEKAVSSFEFRKKVQETDIMLQDLLKNRKPIPLVKTETSQSHNYYVEIGADFQEGSEDISNLESIKSEVDTNDQSYLPYMMPNQKQKDNINLIKVEHDETTYCPACGLQFNEALSLNDHMWKIHGQQIAGPKKRGRPRKCLDNNIINKLSENGIHVKMIPVKTHNCIMCREQCNSYSELKNHMDAHRDTKVFSCLQCKRMYLNKSNFEKHRCSSPDADVEQNDSRINKPVTKTYILNEMYLPEILPQTGDKDKISMCEVCSELFLYDYDVMSHNDADHPEISQRCNLCSKVFASVKSAARHRDNCKLIERKHVCSTCGLKFPYEMSLNKHILRSHEGQSVSVKFIDSKAKLEDKQYQCDSCNKCFYRKDLLAKHAKMHMPNEKSYECDVCHKKFYRKDGLRSHKKVHEVRETPSNSTCLCLYCGRSFSNSSNLIVHMRRHTGERPYKCDFCDKGFPRSSDLQCHRRIHTGEKPCVCRVCGKGFSRSNKLSRHMRVHTGAKPYKCTYCEKAFSQSNDLTLHIRRHTGDKPYICEVCGDRFIQGTALHSHRRVHGHFPPSCTDTPTQIKSQFYSQTKVLPTLFNN